jgi:hypothetical protein
MFRIEDDLSIHVTRGDAITIQLKAKVNGESYAFRDGDKVRFKVFEKKACQNVALQKDFLPVVGETFVDLFLDKDDTKIGDIISKPVDYWYEIELNPDILPQTIIGYDADGSKVFRLYPEGGEKE